MASFELVPDDDLDDDHAPPPVAEPDDTVRRRVARRWRRLSRRSRLLIAGTTAMVVLGVTTAAVLPGALDAHDQRGRAAAVHGMPGVVGDLSDPVEAAWTWPDGTTVASVVDGDRLLVTSADQLTAVDAQTGAPAWHHEFEGDVQCGPPPASSEVDWRTPVDSTVCVHGGAARTIVTVLDADGDVVGERELDVAGAVPADQYTSVRRVQPAAGGAIAIVDASPQITVAWKEGDDPQRVVDVLRRSGWSGPSLRIEDALTGELRAQVTLELTADLVEDCGRSEESGNVGIVPEFGIETTPSLTTFSLCGMARAITPDGVVIDVKSGQRAIEPRPGGGYVVHDAETSRVLDDRGEVEQTLPGWVSPLIVDAARTGPPLTLLPATDGASTLAAIGNDGDTLWTSPGATGTGTLARVGDTIVVVDASGTEVVGLDATTGRQEWSVPGLVEYSRESAEHGTFVAGVATDGTRLLLAISPTSWTEEERPIRLVALDLRDGSIAWDDDPAEKLWSLHSVGGHLIATGNSLVGLN